TTSSQKTEVISRSLLDALPATRDTQSFGYLAQGVRLSKPDVGGQQMMEQVNMRVHGASELHTTMQIDGMLFSPAFNDGAIQNYLNQAHFQEITFTTSSQLGEISAGGVRVHYNPRDGGSPAVVDQHINIPLVRLTGQVTPKNKISAFLDRPLKFKGHEFTYGIEPSRASRRRNPGEANYHNVGLKWTSTVTNRVLLEVGYSEVVERLHTGYQPDVFKTTAGWPRPASIHLSDPVPAATNIDPWFTDVSHYDLLSLQRTVATTNYSGTLPDRRVPMVAL